MRLSLLIFSGLAHLLDATFHFWHCVCFVILPEHLAKGFQAQTFGIVSTLGAPRAQAGFAKLAMSAL